MLHEIFRRFVLPVALTAAFAPALADPGAAASALFGPGSGHELRRLHADAEGSWKEWFLEERAQTQRA